MRHSRRRRGSGLIRAVNSWSQMSTLWPCIAMVKKLAYVSLTSHGCSIRNQRKRDWSSVLRATSRVTIKSSSSRATMWTFRAPLLSSRLRLEVWTLKVTHVALWCIRCQVDRSRQGIAACLSMIVRSKPSKNFRISTSQKSTFWKSALRSISSRRKTCLRRRRISRNAWMKTWSWILVMRLPRLDDVVTNLLKLMKKLSKRKNDRQCSKHS